MDPSSSPCSADSWWDLASCPGAMLSMSQLWPCGRQQKLLGGTWSRGKAVWVENGSLACEAAPLPRTWICLMLVVW